MKIDFKNRQQLLTVIAGAAIALLVGDSLILSPLIKSWQDRSSRITRLRRDIDQGNQSLQSERSIRSRWDTMRTNMLPDDVSIAEGGILKAFDRWSRDSRISITSVKSPMETECGRLPDTRMPCRRLRNPRHRVPIPL